MMCGEPPWVGSADVTGGGSWVASPRGCRSRCSICCRKPSRRGGHGNRQVRQPPGNPADSRRPRPARAPNRPAVRHAHGVVQRPPAGSIPDAPGSYQFKDVHGRVIYVGKAKSLRSRLSNYFQNPANLPPRTAQMVQSAETVEWIQVRNDVEALMLEYSLIKEHQPRFNIRLRDDKSYPFLAVTLDDEWPRAMVDARAQAQGHPVLRALRPRLRHPRDPRPAAAHVPDPHLLRHQVRAAPPPRPAVPAVPHREVLGPLCRRGRRGRLRRAGGGAARVPRRRDRRRRPAARGRHGGRRRRARVRAGGPPARPAHRRAQGHRDASRWSATAARTST